MQKKRQFFVGEVSAPETPIQYDGHYATVQHKYIVESVEKKIIHNYRCCDEGVNALVSYRSIWSRMEIYLCRKR